MQVWRKIVGFICGFKKYYLLNFTLALDYKKSNLNTDLILFRNKCLILQLQPLQPQPINSAGFSWYVIIWKLLPVKGFLFTEKMFYII